MAEGLRGPTAPIACPSDRRDRPACSWSLACRYCSFSSLLLVLTLSPFSSLSANLTATLHFVRSTRTSTSCTKKAFAKNAPDVLSAIGAAPFNALAATALFFKIAKEIEGEMTADKKLDQLIGSFYKDGLSHLMLAVCARSDTTIQGELQEASSKFVTAANTASSPFIIAKARFFAGVCYELSSAESRNLFDNGKQRFIGAAKVSTHTFSQLLSREQAIGFNNRLLGMDPLRLDRVEPGTFGGQKEGQNAHAFALLLDLLIVLTNPG